MVQCQFSTPRHRLASSTISSHWVETLHESGQNHARTGVRRPNFIIAEIILSCAGLLSPQVPYHKMNATCKTWIVTGRTAPISAFRRTPWHNGTRLRRSVFLSRMFWFMSLRIIDGLQPFSMYIHRPLPQSLYIMLSNSIWPEDAIERTCFFWITMWKYSNQLNICKGLFTRLIGAPVLMWQQRSHATMTSIWGHFCSVCDLAWQKSSNDVPSHSKGLVEGTATCFDFYEKRALNFNSELFSLPGYGRRPMAGRHMHETLERRISHFFCLAVQQRDFHVQYQFFKTYLIN